MKIEVDKNDLKLIKDSLCYFDMDRSGTGYYTKALNDSFHYLYNECTHLLKEIEKKEQIAQSKQPIAEW